MKDAPACSKAGAFCSGAARLLTNDLHALPKSDVILDFVGFVLWRRVVPGRVFVGTAVNGDCIVAGQTFPGAGGVRLAGSQILALERIGRKVAVALDHDAPIAFGQDRSVPDCFGHWVTILWYPPPAAT